MFTTFYVGAEMWGDVVLSLLFWGLANEMTTMREAPLLYPLFGIGANIGQTLSGKALSMFATFSESRLSYAVQLQARPLMPVIPAHVQSREAHADRGDLKLFTSSFCDRRLCDDGSLPQTHQYLNRHTVTYA